MAGVIFKVSIPDAEANKTVKVSPGETVWTVKMQLVSKFRNLEHGFNYAFYFFGSAERESGFLDDAQIMLSYQLPNNTELVLKKKQRLLHGIPEKQLQKWNNKKQQKTFMEWVSKKAYSKVKEALQKGFDPNFVEGSETPLSLATGLDDSQMIAFLVQSGGAFMDLRTPDMKTPLHRAAMSGYNRAAQTLLSLGAWSDPRDGNNLTPLFLACASANGEIAKELLKAGSRTDVTDEKGRTELHLACMKNCPLAVQALVCYGAGMHTKNEPGNTPLHLAASSNTKECAKILLEAGVDLEIQNTAGDTPHQVAVMAANWDVADLIGNFKTEQRKPFPMKEGKRIETNLSGLPYMKIVEYIPPPPPVGYKGICAAPPDAPVR